MFEPKQGLSPRGVLAQAGFEPKRGLSICSIWAQAASDAHGILDDIPQIFNGTTDGVFVGSTSNECN